ncbi:MAG: hypothetical protein Ct9H90mP16_15740 [Candidatus Poseidoniales archaeon]|nr:MAG: hypothetical protein Ct9H90mP16_15740 [Candidatus Poseidoniales archaeon]
MIGVQTVFPLHLAILNEPDFIARDVTIQYLEEHPNCSGENMDIVIVGSLPTMILKQIQVGKDSLGGSGTFAGLAAAFHTSRRQDPGAHFREVWVFAIGDDFEDADLQF